MRHLKKLACHSELATIWENDKWLPGVVYIVNSGKWEGQNGCKDLTNDTDGPCYVHYERLYEKFIEIANAGQAFIKSPFESKWGTYTAVVNSSTDTLEMHYTPHDPEDTTQKIAIGVNGTVYIVNSDVIPNQDVSELMGGVEPLVNEP